jgi:hypothetical protein
MSMGLSELAVDLGSFFNAVDADVLVALKAGIVGEAEPLKRFGIVMLEATLQAFALSEGVTKSFKSMSIAEKTALRYRFILDQTQDAQGDAMRTSEGWANATKGMTSALKDLGTRLGLSIIPFAEKVVISIRNATRGFMEWEKGTNVLRAALIVLGAIGAKVALGLLVAWAPVLFPILKFIAIVTVAAFVLGDFLTFMEGGDSVIGRFIDAIFGPGSATEAVHFLRDAWEGMILYWDNEVKPGIVEIGGMLTQAAGDSLRAWGEFFSSFSSWVTENEKTLLAFSDAVRGAIDAVAEFLGLGSGASQKAAEFLGLGGGAPQRGGSRGVTRQDVATEPRLSFAGAPFELPQANVVSNSVTVQVQGNATAKDAARIGEAAGEAQRKANRRTRAATTQRPARAGGT